MLGFGQVGVGWGGSTEFGNGIEDRTPFPLPERAFISEEAAFEQRFWQAFHYRSAEWWLMARA